MKISKKDRQQEMTEHVCTNCHTRYVGKFCPECGQEASVGVVNWESVVEVRKDLLGMNAQSPVSTIAIAIVFMVGSLWLGYWIS